MSSYLIVILLVFLAIIKRADKSKKVTKPSPTSTPPIPKGPLDDIFEELKKRAAEAEKEYSQPEIETLSLPEESSNTPPLEVFEENITDMGSYSMETIIAETSNNVNPSVLQPQPANTIQDLIKEDEITDNYTSIEDFSLRKAVIYSEILNRKY